ncbi:MAG TPA: hypothetical protein VKQ08_07005 [Cyclobacteriaceae bacterium]|nr:hypothetical protein [Cyclobacteriaceae bacterium]
MSKGFSFSFLNLEKRSPPSLLRSNGFENFLSPLLPLKGPGPDFLNGVFPSPLLPSPFPLENLAGLENRFSLGEELLPSRLYPSPAFFLKRLSESDFGGNAARPSPREEENLDGLENLLLPADLSSDPLLDWGFSRRRSRNDSSAFVRLPNEVLFPPDFPARAMIFYDLINEGNGMIADKKIVLAVNRQDDCMSLFFCY